MGYRIKDLREEKGMTQEDLSEKSGVSRGTISALENGIERTTTTKTLLKIAKALVRRAFPAAVKVGRKPFSAPTLSPACGNEPFRRRFSGKIKPHNHPLRGSIFAPYPTPGHSSTEEK